MKNTKLKTCGPAYVPADLHWRLSNKCQYYGISMQSLMLELLKLVDENKIDIFKLFSPSNEKEKT